MTDPPDDGSFMDFHLDDGRHVVARALNFRRRNQSWRVDVYGMAGERQATSTHVRLGVALEQAGAPDWSTMMDQQVSRLTRALRSPERPQG